MPEYPISEAPRMRGFGFAFEEPTRMKAEHRHRLEQNALADRVGRVVEGVKAAPATQSLALWLGVVAIIIVIIAWQLFRSASYIETSAAWRNLNEDTREPDDVIHRLESLREEHPGSNVGTSAGYQLARLKFRAGQANLGNATEFERKEAIKNLVSARDLYVQLAKDSADSPLLLQESMLIQAKIEESLTGVPDPEKPTEILGSLEKAKDEYQALVTKFPESAAGIAAKKRLDDLEKDPARVKEFYVKFNKLMAAPGSSGPINTNPIPAFPTPSLPKLPEGYDTDVKPPVTPPAAKAGETKPPESSTSPDKPKDGKSAVSPGTPPAKAPTVPTLPSAPPDNKPGAAVPPTTKTPDPATPKTGDAKSPPAPAPDKKP